MKKFKPKYKQGDIVLLHKEKVKITDESYISHPELLMGASECDSGFFYMVEPIDENGEDIAGWVSEKSLKKVKQ